MNNRVDPVNGKRFVQEFNRHSVCLANVCPSTWESFCLALRSSMRSLWPVQSRAGMVGWILINAAVSWSPAIWGMAMSVMMRSNASGFERKISKAATLSVMLVGEVIRTCFLRKGLYWNSTCESRKKTPQYIWCQSRLWRWGGLKLISLTKLSDWIVWATKTMELWHFSSFRNRNWIVKDLHDIVFSTTLMGLLLSFEVLQ